MPTKTTNIPVTAEMLEAGSLRINDLRHEALRAGLVYSDACIAMEVYRAMRVLEPAPDAPNFLREVMEVLEPFTREDGDYFPEWEQHKDYRIDRNFRRARALRGKLAAMQSKGGHEEALRAALRAAYAVDETK